MSDVLDVYVGSSENNLHDLFMQARRKVPCVVFIDEIDALGPPPFASFERDAYRTTVDQLLIELDGVEHDNEGVFVLAATNHPWDVEPGAPSAGPLRPHVARPSSPMRRPGRPSSARIWSIGPSQESTWRVSARMTDGYSGADIAHICETAAEKALIESARGGEAARLIEMRHLDDAVAEVRPSLAGWFEAARNVVAFANASGDYDELRDYMKQRRLL